MEYIKQGLANPKIFLDIFTTVNSPQTTIKNANRLEKQKIERAVECILPRELANPKLFLHLFTTANWHVIFKIYNRLYKQIKHRRRIEYISPQDLGNLTMRL